VKELPFGIDTYLGKYVDEENGTDLSGGQAQRLAIARAIFRRPDLLILDEPTSAIDAKAEYTIFKAIDTARQGRTTILISHRFSTVRKADYIYVLEKGHLKEQGTHEELLARRGLYHEMFTKQAAGYL
jgi:ABC-type multidrug transport system fused ATPase/permease subunit